uniref:Uncharacterized protein n=1 Tax=Cacopsylla melanoneura TaxID=428564 RepID=A0A8D8Z800_9HEMI
MASLIRTVLLVSIIYVTTAAVIDDISQKTPKKNYKQFQAGPDDDIIHDSIKRGNEQPCQTSFKENNRIDAKHQMESDAKYSIQRLRRSPQQPKRKPQPKPNPNYPTTNPTKNWWDVKLKYDLDSLQRASRDLKGKWDVTKEGLASRFKTDTNALEVEKVDVTNEDLARFKRNTKGLEGEEVDVTKEPLARFKRDTNALEGLEIEEMDVRNEDLERFKRDSKTLEVKEVLGRVKRYYVRRYVYTTEKKEFLDTCGHKGYSKSRRIAMSHQLKAIWKRIKKLGIVGKVALNEWVQKRKEENEENEKRKKRKNDVKNKT